MVAGVADDDPSSIGTYVAIGAAQGLGLLWAAVLVLPSPPPPSGPPPVSAWWAAPIWGRSPAATFLAPCCSAASGRWPWPTPSPSGADLAVMAAAARLVAPLPAGLLVVLFACGMLVAEVTIPYRRYAAVLRFLALSVLAYPMVLVLAHVDWGDVAHSTLVPRLRFDGSYLGALTALVGAALSPYVLFWSAGEARETAPNDSKALDDRLAQSRLDTTAGAFAALGVGFAVMVASAAAFDGPGHTAVATAEQAAEALKPLAGNGASILFAAAIVGTGLLSVPVLAGSAAYGPAGGLGWRAGLSLPLRSALRFYAVLATAMVLGLAMQVIGVPPIRALFVASIANGLVAPLVLLVVLVLAGSREVLGERTERAVGACGDRSWRRFGHRHARRLAVRVAALTHRRPARGLSPGWWLRPLPSPRWPASGCPSGR